MTFGQIKLGTTRLIVVPCIGCGTIMKVQSEPDGSASEEGYVCADCNKLSPEELDEQKRIRTEVEAYS